MKSSKKTAAKPMVERVGNICATNYWIKLGMTREELAALKQISQIFKEAEYKTTGNALHLVVTTALLHWDKLEPFVYSDQEYCKAEGFAIMEQYRQATLRRKYPALKPDGRGIVAKNKKAERFFKVCMSRCTQTELRDLANAFGMDLRTFIFHAINTAKCEYREMMKTANKNHIHPQELDRLTNLNLVNSRN